MENEDTITSKSYHKEIESIAKYLLKEYLKENLESLKDLDFDEVRENLDDKAHEFIEYHQWVINIKYHFDVLKYSNNWEQIDEFGMIDNNTTIAKVLMNATFCAMKEDVMDLYREDDYILNTIKQFFAKKSK